MKEKERLEQELTRNKNRFLKKFGVSYDDFKTAGEAQDEAAGSGGTSLSEDSNSNSGRIVTHIVTCHQQAMLKYLPLIEWECFVSLAYFKIVNHLRQWDPNVIRPLHLPRFCNYPVLAKVADKDIEKAILHTT